METKLYAVVPIYKNRGTNNGEQKPMLNLAPMNHQAACNFMQACRNRYTDYKLIDWPKNVKSTKKPQIVKNYRN